MRGPRARHADTTRRELNRIAANRAYAQGQGRARHKPLQVFLQVASACNLDCYMCAEHNRPVGMRHGRELSSLSRELYEKIASEIFPLSSALHIGVGGEPMLSPDFAYYVERAWELGQRVNVTTNGTRIDRPEMAELFARCVAYLQVSIDGATQATYERIRLGSKFTRIQRNLSLLNEARLGYPKEERTKLCLSYVLMRSNVDELPAFVEMAARFEAEEVLAHHVIAITEEGKHESLIDEPEHWNAIRAIALERAAELGVELNIPKAFALPPAGFEDPGSAASGTEVAAQAASTRADTTAPPGSRAQLDAVVPDGRRSARDSVVRSAPIACHMPTFDTFIFYDGRVFPCCHPYAHEKMQVGDLRLQSFEEIWNGPLYRNLRVGLNKGYVSPICERCSVVHDPPPGPEDPDTIRAVPELAQLYGDLEFEGSLESSSGTGDLFSDLVKTGIVEHVEALVQGHAEIRHDRDELVVHARTIQCERDALLGHSETIRRERDALQGHAATIQRERDALLGQVTAIRAERDALLGHVGNLERMISKTGARWTYRVLGGVRGFLFPKKPS